MTIVSWSEAKAITTGYVCAACWGLLTAHPTDDYDSCRIECVECGADTPGFVSYHWVERRISENQAEYLMARDALKDAIPWMFPHTAGKSESQLLSELGF